MNVNKRKGTKWESDVVTYLKPYVPSVERRALAGSLDKGDLAGIPDWVCELKNHKDISLSQYMTEAKREAANAGVANYCAIVKARNKPTSQAYVVMPLEIWAQLIDNNDECP